MSDTVSRPQFYVAAGVMAVVVLIIVIDRGYESGRAPRSADRRALETIGWSMLVALDIGILLARAMNIPTLMRIPRARRLRRSPRATTPGKPDLGSTLRRVLGDRRRRGLRPRLSTIGDRLTADCQPGEHGG